VAGPLPLPPGATGWVLPRPPAPPAAFGTSGRGVSSPPWRSGWSAGAPRRDVGF